PPPPPPPPPPLPPSPPAVTAPPAPSPAAAATESLRILVVEDVEMNRLLAVTLLKQAGHSVAAVADGAQAVEAAVAAAGAEPFDAILMDVNMPVMDGLEATRVLRAMPGPVSRTVIVALTANTFPDDIAQCYEVGMDCHVPKPIDRVQLLTEVARCVASRRAVEAMGEG
ncbi:response regulator, partial [Azospirillum oryzae]|uniref:response regulator n=1 Tax=Azospirillum oryzae TaxID=286727 RepID=UPI0024E1356A